jgi:hypothetical protein
LREAAAPPVPQPPSEDEACAEPAREARPYIIGAEAIQKTEWNSCPALLQAAENYFTAGKIFFRAIKSGLTKEQIEASCENKKTNEMFRRRDALIDLVDKKEEKGECQARQRVARTSPPSNGSPSPTDQCKRDLDQLTKKKKEYEDRIAQLQKPIEDDPDHLYLRKRLQARLGQQNEAIDPPRQTDPNLQYYKKTLAAIDAGIVELAAKGCREPGSPKFSQGMCLSASEDLIEKGVPQTEIHAQMVAAGCSQK